MIKNGRRGIMFLKKMPNSVPMISAMMRLIASTMIDLTSEKETHQTTSMTKRMISC
jgi:hypothetical protein